MKLRAPSRAATSLVIFVALVAVMSVFSEQLSAQKSGDETTAKLVCEMVTRYHISQKGIDDEVSARLVQRYIEVLDPMKLYFLKSDIDRYMTVKTELDDMLKVGNVEFAYKAFDDYLIRVKSQIEAAHALIDAEHNFSLDETMVVNPKDLSWAKTPEELTERWRKRIKYDLLSLKLDDTDLADARDRLHKRYNTVRRTAEQTEDSETLEMYLSALTHCFDPHSSYMSPQTLKDFQIAMELSLEGIGAALRSEDGFTTVAQIVPGGAAEKDGRLKVGDKIMGVAQADGEFVDVVEMKLSKVVQYIRGPKDTVVRLQVKTADTGEIKVYELTRQKIELKSSEVKGEIIEAGARLDGRKGKIGVIHIPSFYRDFRGAQRGVEDFKSTSRDVLKVLTEFKQQGGVDAVVVDLRTNGGGALSEAIEVSGLFIDEGPVVQVKEQNGRIKSHDDISQGVAYDGPLVVICNRLSASASEIFAGVIKDYGRGIVIGDTTTHGKGTVQNVMPVSRRLFEFLNAQDRGALKLTINQFYRVNGDSTQNKGVESDVVLPSLIDHMDLGESFLDNALEFDRIPPAEFEELGKVSPKVVSVLRQNSQARIAQDAEFQQTVKDIQRYLGRKNRKTISLNEETLRTEREEDKKVEKEEEKLEDQENGEGPIFPENAYNKEVLAITVDYLGLIKGTQTVGK